MANVLVVISLFLFGVGLVALKDARKGYTKNIPVKGYVVKVRNHYFTDEDARGNLVNTEEVFDTTYEYTVRGRTYTYTEKNRSDRLEIGRGVILYCNEAEPDIVFIVHVLINGIERHPLDDAGIRRAARSYLLGGIGLLTTANALFVYSFAIK